MKKIGILTQPLKNNYGGLLQAYALQKYLSSAGHNVLTIDLAAKHDQPTVSKIAKRIIANIIKKYILRKKITSIFPQYENTYTSKGIQTRRFVLENIRTTHKLMNNNELPDLESYNFDTYVVGSDQVWRSIYSPNISSFFLDFLDDNSEVTRVAYAASFGTDNCDEYTESELRVCSAYAKKFDAIAVREDTGVELCRKYFDVEAEHVIDPTLLLEASDYIQLVNKDYVGPSQGNMMVYVLDEAQDKRNIIARVAKKKGLKPFFLMPEKNKSFPAVTKWLRGFMDAEYVVTDSFHGVIFSIIFNKQFLAIGNKGRGLARFKSILSKFQLESRLVISDAELSDSLIKENIDYIKVNRIKKEEQELAVAFLEKHLNN